MKLLLLTVISIRPGYCYFRRDGLRIYDRAHDKGNINSCSSRIPSIAYAAGHLTL